MTDMIYPYLSQFYDSPKRVIMSIQFDYKKDM